MLLAAIIISMFSCNDSRNPNLDDNLNDRGIFRETNKPGDEAVDNPGNTNENNARNRSERSSRGSNKNQSSNSGNLNKRDSTIDEQNNRNNAAKEIN